MISFASGDWWYHSHAHADFQVASLLSADRRVLIVNSMGMRRPSLAEPGGPGRILRKVRSTAHLLRRPTERLAVLSPIFLPVYGDGVLAKINTFAVAAQVLLAMRWLGISSPGQILANPTALDVATHTSKGPLVFYRLDHFSATEDVDHDLIASMEDRSFAACDVVLYSSQALMEREADRHLGKAMLFEHGVDTALFDPARPLAEPADLAGVPHPRVLMMGSLEKADRVEQINEVAAQLPDVSIVVVGGGVGATGLTGPNIHAFGVKPHHELPEYVAHCDVGMVVVARSEWGSAASPIKVKEYLAMGIPVVSGWFSGVEDHASVLRYGKTIDEISTGIRLALQDRGPSTAEGRRQYVLGDSWESRASFVASLLRDRRAPVPAGSS